MDDNNFDGPIPDWLGEFEHLRNMFSLIPTNLRNLSSLITLDVGSIPLTERNLTTLSKLKEPNTLIFHINLLF